MCEGDHTPPPDPRDSPEAWMRADPTMSLADAEWYAANWRAATRAERERVTTDCHCGEAV